MNFYVESTGDYEICPSGMHLARCYRLIDLGTQKSEYLGQVKFLPKLMLGWEIHGSDENGDPIKMQDGRPFGIFKNYTRSWTEKSNLRKDLQSWRGRAFSQEELRRFNLPNILGAWCMLNVIHREGKNGGTYANVQSVTPVPSVMKGNLPAEVNKVEFFSLDNPDMDLFEKFSDVLKAKISASPQWQKRQNPNASERVPGSDDDIGDDIPF